MNVSFILTVNVVNVSVIFTVKTAAEIGLHIAPRRVEYALAQKSTCHGPVRQGGDGDVLKRPPGAGAAAVAPHHPFAEQTVKQRDVFEAQVGYGNKGVRLTTALGGVQEATASGASAGLMLLLRTHPHRPPHSVASVDVLVCYVVNDASAAGAWVWFDVNALERIVEPHVDELAVANAVHVVVGGDGTYRRSYTEMDIYILHENVLGAVGEGREGRAVGGLQTNGVVEVGDGAVAHSDVLALDVDAVGVEGERWYSRGHAVAADAQTSTGCK